MRDRWKGLLLAGLAAAALWASASSRAAEGSGNVLARWLFDEGKGTVASDGAGGAADGRIERATWSTGRSSGALAFEDYSILNYLKPDVREATRVVVPHVGRLNPPGPFTLRAAIYPTRSPLYFGGIFEKGRGYGASLRLILRRGLRPRAVYGPDSATVDGAEPLSLDAWHEVELRFDGDTLTLKVDGKVQGRTSGVKPGANSPDPVVIGERFSGKIDEVVLTSP